MRREIEEWVPILNWKYAVSSYGRIMRLLSGGNTYPGKILKPYDRCGYLRICLNSKFYSIHCLVAAEFIGPRPTGMEINHKDLDKSNNCYWNLEYVRPVQNKAHAERNGRGGGTNGTSGKLTIKERKKILMMWGTGQYSKLGLGKVFGVSDVAINYIISRPNQWDGVS